jgi:hypothetical protein
VLIMPTATRRSAVVSEGGPVGGGSKVGWIWYLMKCQILDILTSLFMDSIIAYFVPKAEFVLPFSFPFMSQVFKPALLCILMWKHKWEEFHIARVKHYGKTLNCVDICQFVAGIFADGNEPSVSMTVGNFLMVWITVKF